MKIVAAFLAGLLFGVGLLVSGMTNPMNVIGFLDLTGAFNPRLAAVMAGAVAVTFIGYRLVLRRGKPIFAGRYDVPHRTAISRPLIVGSVIFGIGWGMTGFCPGPALVGLGAGNWGAAIVVVAMFIGFAAARQMAARHRLPTAAPAEDDA